LVRRTASGEIDKAQGFFLPEFRHRPTPFSATSTIVASSSPALGVQHDFLRGPTIRISPGGVFAWLTRTFAFTEHYHYGEPGEPISGAQMRFGDACFMLKRARPGCASPARLGYGTQSLTVFVESIEAHFERAKSAGAKLLEHLHETVYGELQYAVEDLDGHHWLFSRHARDLSPEEWGAKLARR